MLRRLSRGGGAIGLALLVIGSVVLGAAGTGGAVVSQAAPAQASAGSVKCGNDAVPQVKKLAAKAYGIPATDISTHFGQSAKGSCTYKGTGHFTLNLNKCPSSFNANQGITKKSIDLFTSMPHSGALAAYGDIGTGLKNYLSYVNAHGGVDGRKVKLTIMTDQYEPQLTRENVDKAIAADKYAAGVAILGSSNQYAVWTVMNKDCMPDLTVAASDDSWGTVTTHPWTTGFGLNYANEVALWVAWMKKQYPNGAKVVEITMDNAFGLAYANDLKSELKGTKFQIVGDELHSPTAPDIQNQVTSAAATNAQVAVIEDAGTFCTEGIGEIQKSSWKPQVIVGNACAQISTTFAPLEKQGLTGNGTHVVRYYYAPTTADNANKKFATLEEKQLKAGGLTATNAQFANGWFWGWYVVQLLKDAATLKGGLNRANIMVAARSWNEPWPQMVPGVKTFMKGAKTAYGFQGGQMYTYAGATATKTGNWKPAGPVVNEPDGNFGTYDKLLKKLGQQRVATAG